MLLGIWVAGKLEERDNNKERGAGDDSDSDSDAGEYWQYLEDEDENSDKNRTTGKTPHPNVVGFYTCNWRSMPLEKRFLFEKISNGGQLIMKQIIVSLSLNLIQ